MTRTGRRALLGAVAAAPLASLPAAAGESSPDAGLIALCAELDRLERQRLALFYGPERIEDDRARDDAMGPIYAARGPLLDRVLACSAATAAGVLAKARTLALFAQPLRDYPDDDDHLYDDRLLLGSLLRDAMRIGHPDQAANLAADPHLRAALAKEQHSETGL